MTAPRVNHQQLRDEPSAAGYVDDDAFALIGPALFEGDIGQLPAICRTLLARILANRTTLGDDDPDLWDALITNREVLTSRLHDMWLDLEIDVEHRIAIKRQMRPDGYEVPILLRETRFSREATAALLCLRERFNAQRIAGATTVEITREALEDDVQAFQRADETNLTARHRDLMAAINTLTEQKILLPTSVPDKWRISPVIEMLLTASAVNHLADWLTRPSGDVHGQGTSTSDDSD